MQCECAPCAGEECVVEAAVACEVGMEEGGVKLEPELGQRNGR